MGSEQHRGVIGRRAWSSVTTLVIFTLLTAGCWSDRGGGSTSPAGSVTPIVSPAQTPSPQALPYDGLEVVSEQKAGGWTVLADAFGVWVAGGGTLKIVDPESGAMSPVGAGPWDYDYTVLAEYGEGSIFLGSGTTLWELAIDGTVIHRFHLPAVGYIDAVHVVSSSVELWVAGSGAASGNVVARVDPDSGRVMDRYSVDQGLHQVTDAAGYVFVASRASRHPVQRIDPMSRAQRAVPTIGPAGIVSIAGVNDLLWVEEGDSVRCIDATSFTPCGEVRIPNAQQITADGHLLWVLSGAGRRNGANGRSASVTLMNGLTGAVLGGPVALPGANALSISAFDGSAWVGFYGSNRLVRIDRCDPPCS